MRNSAPPKFIKRLLYWFIRRDLIDELVGDLEESFHNDSKALGLRKAKWNYVRESIRLFRPSVWEIGSINVKNSNFMFRNYTKVTLRNLQKQKLFSSINLAGLALSLSVCLLIISIIVDQLSFDRFHAKYKSIYRIITHNEDLKYGWQDDLATTSLPLFESLSNRDEISNIVRIRRNFWGDVESETKVIPLSGHMADANFFNMFSFNLTSGHPDYALREPFSVVLTESAKSKLFGRNDALGKTIKVGRFGEYMVTGIMEDPPRTSHMQFDMIGSFNTLPALENLGIQTGLDNWGDFTGNYIYLEIHGSIESLQAWLHRIGETESRELPNRKLDFEFQPLSSISPGMDLANQIGPTFSSSGIWALTTLSMIILLLASFNYVNLTLAKSMKRYKEVGIRKVMGGKKSQLVFQFIFESVILSLLAVIPAFLLMTALKPQFFSLVSSNKAQFLTFEITPAIIIAIILFAIATGILAGLIPALTMSRVKVSEGLRDKMIKLFTGVSLRKGLVVIQFGIALFFLTLTSIAYKYYDHLLNYDLGFTYDEIYNIRLQGVDKDVFDATFRQIPEVEQVSFSSYLLSTNTKNSNSVITEDKSDTLQAVNLRIDANYINNHEFDLLAGNTFADFVDGNENRVVVNEELIKRIGIANAAEAIGKIIWVEGNQMVISGVVANFHHSKSNQPIEPFYFMYNKGVSNYGNLKIRSDNMLSTISKLEEAWRKVDNDVHVYDGSFYSDQIEQAMQEIKTLIKLVGFVASLTIFISILGVLGMIVFTCESRIKEIGIRKVMGASVSAIVVILSKGYLRVLAFASLIAVTLVYILYSNVISPEISNKPPLGVLDYVGGVLIVLIIGAIIILVNGISAARKNPVVSLKEE